VLPNILKAFKTLPYIQNKNSEVVSSINLYLASIVIILPQKYNLGFFHATSQVEETNG
jgi:hypothetical protein